MLTACSTFELTGSLRNSPLTFHARGNGFYIMFITIFLKFFLNTPCTIAFLFISQVEPCYQAACGARCTE